MTEQVYILSNPSMPGLIKIGRTKSTSIIRANSLFTSGVPEKFILEAFAIVPDSKIVESNIHKLLDSYRVPSGREFFKINKEKAIKLINGEFQEIVWCDSPECKDETIKQSSKWKKFIEKYEHIHSEAIIFEKFMIEHKWFPNDNDYDADTRNRVNFEVIIKQNLKMLKDGINARPEAIKNKLPYIRIDDKSMREDLDKIEIELKSIQSRFKDKPNKSSPCMCNSCVWSTRV